MPRAQRGVLVRADPSIKAIIVKIDAERNDFIIEDIDDECILVKEDKYPELKVKLEQKLQDTVKKVEDSSSE
ncbi:RNA polymerase II transcription factor B subunit 5 [Aulographum hederae CBS 113979]|uniref:General transcription and DNA repair factor IIH subunit TFB5 n=1 Tax=Aulographum hederae CBS 113979 TaxID=1176131 RepID=A0A6G1GZ94_9PEZI|nr:RNA polymerase II transcription factor B subunit 5 [Aulographum hederae CBS 113979]